MENRSIINVLLFSAMALSLTACPPAEHHRKVLDTSFLQLGELGEKKVESDIPTGSHLVVLADSQNMRFIDDAGTVEIKGVTTPIVAKQIIVGNSANKALLEVIEVVSSNGGVVVAKTRLAKMAQLSKEGDATFSYEITPEISVEKSIKTTGSFTVNKDSSVDMKDVEFYKFSASKSGKINTDKVKVLGGLDRIHSIEVAALTQGDFSATIKKGHIELTPTFRTNAKFSFGKPRKIESRIDALLKYEFDIEYKFTSKGTFSIESEILPTKTIPIRIPGTVPVYVDIEIQIPAGIKFSSESAGTMSVRYAGSYSFATKLTYEPKTGLVKKVDQDFTADETVIQRPKSEATVSAEFFLEPKITTRLYRVLGPYAYLHPYIKGEVQFPLKKATDELFMGISGGVGLQVSEPVFDSSLIRLDSGPLFNVYKGWDLVSPRPTAKTKSDISKTLVNKKAEEFKVSTLTPEGFVVIHLKDVSDRRLVNFQITEMPTRGLLVPADQFQSTGKVYYFPLSKKLNESVDGFSYTISKGKHVGVPQRVSLLIGKSVINSIKKPRFGITSNSVNMSFTGPKQNENKVAHFRVGDQVTESVSMYKPSFAEQLARYKIGLTPVMAFQPIPTNRVLDINGRVCQLKVKLKGLKFLTLKHREYASFKLEYIACGRRIDDIAKYGLKPASISATLQRRSGNRSDIPMDIMAHMESGAFDGELFGSGELRIDDFNQIVGGIGERFDNESSMVVSIYNGQREIRIFNRKGTLGENCCSFTIKSPSYRGQEFEDDMAQLEHRGKVN